jgi:16S rRNA processing protein RimM
VKARGIRGEVLCDIETDFPERYEALRQATIWMPNGERLTVGIAGHWFHKDRVVFKFSGCDTMTDAEQYVGGRLVVDGSDAGRLGDGEYYEHQIVGSEVLDTDGRSLGVVKRLVRTGGTDVLVVERDGSREYLIPFASDICTEVDVDAKRILIHPPEGLLDL